MPKIKLPAIYASHMTLQRDKVLHVEGTAEGCASVRILLDGVSSRAAVVDGHFTCAVGPFPAGTGKTYLACAMAINAYKNKEVERIILTRPAVEAGERLGFLPGDMQEKVDPYLRPLYDALYDVLGIEAAARLREKGVIEVVPLAYMRGRTLDNAFIILDEAQNTTREQMKMFLTRMGFNSKVVVTGDITQIDLPGGTVSGLKEARKVLNGVEGIRFNTFTEVDVVRHELVKRIIRAYDSYDNKNRVRATTSKGNKVSDR